jgi:sensor histidine kinase regulating citrate/malate metabolism
LKIHTNNWCLTFIEHHDSALTQVVYCNCNQDNTKQSCEGDGVGIPKSEKEKIFKEGYGKGTGYGLYLIRKMCEVYGWTIHETGKHGKGAQFTIAKLDSESEL